MFICFVDFFGGYVSVIRYVSCRGEGGSLSCKGMRFWNKSQRKIQEYDHIVLCTKVFRTLTKFIIYEIFSEKE